MSTAPPYHWLHISIRALSRRALSSPRLCHRGLLWSFCVLAISWLPKPPHTIYAQEIGPAAVLLKDTERVLHGKVVRRGEFFEIEIANDSKVSIPVAKVAHLGASLHDLYEFKRSSVSRWSVGDHYQLTQWCLMNDLLPQAVEHYAAVSTTAADHPRVKQLAVELGARLLREADFRQYLGLAPTPLSEPANTERIASQTAKSDVVTASSLAFQTAKHPEIARKFAERIQPILINRCSQGACHGVRGTSDLRLIEPYAKEHARITSENLTSVLRQVATQANELSPLVRYATRPHGIQREAAIALTETNLLNELQSWIAFVQNPVIPAVGSGSSRPVQTADQRVFVPFQPAVKLTPVQPGAADLKSVPRAGTDPTNPAFAPPGGTFEVRAAGLPSGMPPDDLPTPEEIDALDAQLRSLMGNSPTRDPFDPAEFNRQANQPQP